MPQRIFGFFASLKLTIVCLAAMILLVFVGTLAQVNLGGHDVQVRFFQSFFIWWHENSQGWKIPLFPGGHLLGGILLLNLIAAHVSRFRWTWKKLGIQLIHGGLIILLAGGLFTDLFSTESFMRLAPGETKNYSEDPRSMELAISDTTQTKVDQGITIPDGLLKSGEVISHESIPFRIVVRRFYQNSQLHPVQASSKEQGASTQGEGKKLLVTDLPHVTAENRRDSESALIEILPLTQDAAQGTKSLQSSLGTWLVSDRITTPQKFNAVGKTWSLELRLKRYDKPYSLTLRKFSHEHFPGTEIAKKFASTLFLSDPRRGEMREVLITMNHPLRYHGETFFQSGFEMNDTATILQVVDNPVFIAPYLACGIVAVGMLLQFGSHLFAFLRRGKIKEHLMPAA